MFEHKILAEIERKDLIFCSNIDQGHVSFSFRQKKIQTLSNARMVT
jgi:hypothetical protein